ncbi:MAG: hypothetical protein A2X13_11575 [Bacteroidetes bacterium GWC2_33_15]|nr:MAG: hypothetical protein A2X10_05600 [Bacteroidetes bacterium GWA2_33_15]OFX50777.1 MAG: hypothetical protein A2X13_11575 [Bacteroidetes bacterium GWC2_33_15]OFX62940.1 MAG: hypothetical protein A2X15_09795 [Bacteroidetes bacterium GWB2_32_14]OFX70010.1 MAG: hypothetical protein A2X14_02655 [Bacteroidetes bacterium GWD2_33_33]HAN19006.1 hypothetical protein [Bacteroidales bacterium]
MDPIQQPPYPQYNYQEESIDIKKYLFKFLLNWYWFALALALALSVAYMVNRYSEPTYTISSSIIVTDKQSDMASVEAIIEELGMSRRNRKAVVENEITILKSYKMARMAIEKLDFDITYVAVGRREIAETKAYTRSPFIVHIDTTHNQLYNYPVNIKILSGKEYLLEINDKYNIKQTLRFGESFDSDIFKFKIDLRKPESFVYDKNQSNKYYFFLNEINSLAKNYRNRLNIEVNDKKGTILNLSITGFVPEQIADYLNTLSNVYIQSDLDEKNLRTSNTLQFIDEQMKSIVDSLNAAELNLQNFRVQNQVFDLSQKGKLIFDKLNLLQTEKNKLELQKRYYVYIEKYLENSENYEPVIAPSVMAVENLTLQNIINTLNSLISEQNRVAYTAERTAPNRIILEQQIKELKDALKKEISSTIHTSQIALQQYNEQIQEIEQDIQSLPVNERQLVNIERVFKLNNDLYTFLLEKRAEAGITKASNVADNKILDIARPENANQIKPKRSMNYLIALILGLGIPGFIIILTEFFNTKIEEKKDIEQNTKIPIIGTIGHNETQSDIAVYTDPKSSLAESFRSLRTNLQYILREKNQKVIMITSTVSGEGKTFAAINLASIICMTGKKVLLVGLDLRKPGLHRVFDTPNETGISTYLIGQSEYAAILKPTMIENLWLAPSGPVPPNPAELIETDKMKDFFELVKNDFDYIIVDTPPVAIVTDALLVSQFAHANIFILRQKYSSKHVFELINSIHDTQKMENMNILVNDIKIPKYYGYGYNYGYGYGYGYGYEYRGK